MRTSLGEYPGLRGTGYVILGGILEGVLDRGGPSLLTSNAKEWGVEEETLKGWWKKLRMEN